MNTGIRKANHGCRCLSAKFIPCCSGDTCANTEDAAKEAAMLVPGPGPSGILPSPSPYFRVFSNSFLTPSSRICQPERLLLLAAFVRFKKLPILPLRQRRKAHLGVSLQNEGAALFKALGKLSIEGLRLDRGVHVILGLRCCPRH